MKAFIEIESLEAAPDGLRAMRTVSVDQIVGVCERVVWGKFAGVETYRRKGANVAMVDSTHIATEEPYPQLLARLDDICRSGGVAR